MTNIEYLTDIHGEKKAVVIPIEIWNKIIVNNSDNFENLEKKQIQIIFVEQTSSNNNQKLPKAGLHLGAISMSDDFDEPLSDSFWLGEE